MFIVPGLLVWPIRFRTTTRLGLLTSSFTLTSTQLGVNIGGVKTILNRSLPYGLHAVDHECCRSSLWPDCVGGQIRFVQWCRSYSPFSLAGYLAAGRAPIWHSRPRCWLALLTRAGLGEWYPNQSGFRSLTLPIAC